MEAISFDFWLDNNIDEDDPNEMLELYIAVRDGKSNGSNWNAIWDGEMLIVEGGEIILPLHSKSSRDCFLHMMEQRWGGNTGEEGFFSWVARALEDEEDE
jgi:hypothetical protein